MGSLCDTGHCYSAMSELWVARVVQVTVPIYTVRFLLTIVACDFCSARCSRHGKIVYDFHDIKLPVATIVVGF